MGSLGEVIKKMAVGANDANAPTSVLFGTVTSINPLEITVEQKLKLTKEFLVLTKNVKDYTVDVSVDWETERKSLNANHSHTLNGDISVSSNFIGSRPNKSSTRISLNESDNDLPYIKSSTGNITFTVAFVSLHIFNISFFSIAFMF